MEGAEESVRSPGPVPDVGSGLRLRPVKTNRGAESPEKPEYAVPSYTYLEEVWEDEPMTPAGRVFTEMNSNFVCVCVLGFENFIDIRKFKAHIELTIMKHKRFSSRVEIRKGRPWWTQVKTHVDNHVFEVEFTAEQKEDKDCILNYTADVVVPKPFDPSRPLWDVHVLHAKFGQAEDCCVMRIHHSLGDGTSLMSLLMACTRIVEKPNMLPSTTTSSQDNKKASAPAVMTPTFVSRIFSVFWKYLLVCWYSFLEIGKAGATLICLQDSSTVIKGYAGIEDFPRRCRFVTLSVEDLKSVSKTMGVTINDVFMAMAAHGLRRYLQYRAEKDLESGATTGATEDHVHEGNTIVGEGKKPVKLDGLRVRAVALINMRAAPGLQELSEMMNGQSSQARWGNHMGYLLLPLPMKHYSDPLKLLREMQAIGIRKKASLEGAFSYAIGELLMRLFGQKVAAAVVTKATLQTSISLSNVRGPTERVMFGDNPIVHIIPSVVGHPHSLTLHLQSYDREISIVAMTTTKLLPDPEYFLELCVEGLEEIKKAVVEQSLKE